MTEWLGFALLCFSSLIAMVDPPGAVPVYISTTASYTPEHRNATLRRAVLTGFLVLVTFGMLGTWIFNLFHITTQAFRIAGGIILFEVGSDMVQAKRSRVKTTEQEEADAVSHGDDVAIIPLGIPLLAGPGAITTVIALLAQAPTLGRQMTVYASILAVMVVTWLVLRVAPLVADRLGPTGIAVIERIMGLLVMVIGVQFAIDGITEVVLQVAARLP